MMGCGIMRVRAQIISIFFMMYFIKIRDEDLRGIEKDHPPVLRQVA